MKDDFDLKPVLVFLDDLKKHNHKPWFDQNRSAYENAKVQFESFVDRLIGEFGKVEDLGGLTAKDCVMRIYRDIRFSKDKSPYRTSMSATIAPGGKRSSRLGYYLHLEPHSKSMLAGGLHMPEGGQLTKFRQAIGEDARSFKSIINDKSFKSYFGDLEGEKLKTTPQGYDRDHPEIELLRMKEVVAVHRLPDEYVLSPKLTSHAVHTFTAMKPFLDYLNSVIA